MNDMKFYDHQPGNGTRYPCYIGQAENRNWVLVWLRDGGAMGKAFVFAPNAGLLHYSYLMEKLEVNEADAAGLMPLISEVTGRLCALPIGFGINGCYDGNADCRFI
jgi:hypothetical protein